MLCIVLISRNNEHPTSCSHHATIYHAVLMVMIGQFVFIPLHMFTTVYQHLAWLQEYIFTFYYTGI